jgi:hypothetical protein
VSFFYPSWWRKNFLLVELGIALALMGVLAVWSSRWGGYPILLNLVKGNRGAIYGALASLFGSLLGFSITAMSIVLGFATADRLALLRSSSHYKDLWATFVSAIRVLGITTIAALVGLIFDREAVQRPYIFVTCIGLSSLCILRMARCLWVLERLVKILIAPE